MKIKWLSLKHTPTLGIMAFILMSISSLWYVSQLIQFGIVFDQVDLTGLYFISSFIALIMVFKSGDAVMQNRFIFIVCALSTLATILFLGQFLGTFGSIYDKRETIYFDFLRAITLLAAGTTMLTLKPSRHFIVPRYLLIITGCAAAYWVLVYAFPGIVREWYGTRSAPSEMFPDGLLLLSKRNPERDVQQNALILLMIVWLATIALGRFRYRKAQEVITPLEYFTKTKSTHVTDKNVEKSKMPEEKISRGFLDMGVFKTIKWAFLAGFVFMGLTTGKEKLEQFGRWIDGESTTTPISVPAFDEPMLPGSRSIRADDLHIGSFEFSIEKHWPTVESDNFNYVHDINFYYSYLLNPSGNFTDDKSPYLVSTPKVYTVILPNEAGHIFSVHKRVFIKVSNDAKDFATAMDALTKEQQKNTSIMTGTSILSPDKNVIILGNFDKNSASPDDIFDMALSTQISFMSGGKNEGFSEEVKRSRRSQTGAYTIAEIDYTYTMDKQQQRRSAVLYWHYKEGAPWGDLGIFLVTLNEKAASKNRKALRKTFSSLHLKDGDQEIWRNLNYDVSPDAEIMPFVRINIDPLRLKAFGLTIKQVEEMLKANLPITTDDIQDIAILMPEDGSNIIRLSDIAMTYNLGWGNQKIQDFNSIILTVTSR